MKKLSTLLFIIIISFSTLSFAACSNNSLPTLNMAVYFKSNVSASVYKTNVPTSKTIDISELTHSSFNATKMDRYLDFKIEANPNWIYKMYIEKIEFYAIPNISSDSQMTLTLSMTNLANENNLSVAETFTDSLSNKTEKNSAQKFVFYINKTVAKATGSTITIDITEESSDLLSLKEDSTEFKWQIYGFRVYGESREYLK